MPDRAVVDASAVAVILFGEGGSEEVLLAAEGAELVAPCLLPFELANVAWKKASRSPAQRKAILEALGLFEALDIRLLDIEPVPVARLALDLGITAYDASYVWLSRRLDAPLITLDLRLKRALG
ncbi:MAG: hypothetical protein DIJKHBIC_01941 [Thermoanaerobaculia bacterium]|nr:hypothetical protein [Thermoanaerobaculia bacterium]